LDPGVLNLKTVRFKLNFKMKFSGLSFQMEGLGA
jgi:hypothetical protein